LPAELQPSVLTAGLQTLPNHKILAFMHPPAVHPILQYFALPVPALLLHTAAQSYLGRQFLPLTAPAVASFRSSSVTVPQILGLPLVAAWMPVYHFLAPQLWQAQTIGPQSQLAGDGIPVINLVKFQSPLFLPRHSGQHLARPSQTFDPVFPQSGRQSLVSVRSTLQGPHPCSSIRCRPRPRSNRAPLPSLPPATERPQRPSAGPVNKQSCLPCHHKNQQACHLPTASTVCLLAMFRR